jgi:predicted Zn-dependent protease
MISRPRWRAGLLAWTAKLAAFAAVAAVLAGCSDPSAAPTNAPPGVDAVQERLLADAGQAMAAGDLVRAAGLLDRALARRADDPATWVAVARLRFRGGEHLGAIEAADRALALGPDHPPALLIRALMVRDAHGHRAALPWFGAALAADPQSADGWAEFAATLGDLGEARAMLAAVRRLSDVAPEDPRVFYLQAVLAARGGNSGLARSLLARSGKAEQGVPAAMLLGAVLDLSDGNPDSAAATLETLVQRQPANPRLRELLARALLDGGRDRELVDRFAGEIEHRESSPYLLMLIARAYERLGARGRAAPLLARAYRDRAGALGVLTPRPGLPGPTAALRSAARAGDTRQTARLLQSLRRRFPASADVASLSGDAMLANGDPRAALAYYARAAKVRRPFHLARKAALAAERSGDRAASAQLLARAAEGEPENADALIALARARAQAGDWRRAGLLIDHAIVIGAGHDEALLRLRIAAAEQTGRDADAARYAAVLRQMRPPQLVP